MQTRKERKPLIQEGKRILFYKQKVLQKSLTTTHISFDDAEEELKRMEEFRKAQAEIEKKNDVKAVSQKMFKVV